MKKSGALLETNGLVTVDFGGFLRVKSRPFVKQFAEEQSGAEEQPKHSMHGFAPIFTRR
jgi:hypothetical protein